MSDREFEEWSDQATRAFDVLAGEFVVVTADGADVGAFTPLCSLLRRVRKAFGLEAAFISEWAGGEQVVRHACGEREPSRECDALQSLFGIRLLRSDERDAGDDCFDAVPVIANDGIEYGTLCCRGTVPGRADHGAQHQALRAVAGLIARWFEEAQLSLSDLAPLAGSSMMGPLAVSGY
jgi:hypothetical protein